MSEKLIPKEHREDAPARSSSPMARKPLLLVLGGLVCAALAFRFWSDSQIPPVRRLKLAVKVRTDQKPRFDRRTPGPTQTVLTIDVDPSFRPQSDGTMEGPKWRQEVLKAEYRALQDKPWQPVPHGIYVGPSGGGGAFQQELRVHYPKAGYWKATVRASVQYSRPTSSEEWMGEMVQEIEQQVLPADSLPRLPEDMPENAIVLNPKKNYLRKIQWAEGDAGPWKDVPLPGQPGFPLTVDQYRVIGFRAVKAHPKEPWPDYPKYFPYWKHGKESSEYMGDDVWVHFPDVTKDNADLYPVSVYCGKSLTVYVKVRPERLRR